MSNDQENFLKNFTITNPASNMSNFDELLKILSYFKYYSINGVIDPKADLMNLFLYQYQLQHKLYLDSLEKQKTIADLHFYETKLETKPLQKDTLNTTDLLKESIEKIFNSNENKTSLKRKKEEYQCSCNVNFECYEAYKQHLKQTNHKRTIASPILSNDQNGNSSSQKMVRGQEEWVNNSRNNNFISQILKCLECSASFDTLDDLSLHMLKSNHFSKFHPNQTVLNSSRSTSPCLKKTCSNNFAKTKTLCSSKTVKNNFFVQNIKEESNKPKVSNLQRNLPTSDYKKLTCNICKKIFHEQSSLPPLIELIQHLKKIHSINYICTNCGEYFDNSKNLNEHLVEFHQFNNSLQSNKKPKLDSNNDMDRKEYNNTNSFSSGSSSSSNSSSPNSFMHDNSKEKLNHPLIALQMFVNGTSELGTQNFQKTQKAHNLISPVAQNNEKMSKLPAKKRPYFVDSEENDSHESKKIKITPDENTKLNTKYVAPKNDSAQSILNSQNTSHNSHYQPLNLLQNMRFFI